MVYKCFELHSHTVESDGEFTVQELCGHAADFLYDGIAITDHNTMSAMEKVSPELEARTVPVIPGIEWTTYYGHMVVIGAERSVDWRFARPDTIDEYTRAIKDANGIVGIAHPFEMGSPICTGCHWDFKITDWNNVDYIEVWSEPFPQSRLKNYFAFHWWTELLNRGYHLAASAGWDWHGLDGKLVLPAATYLGLKDGKPSLPSVREALRSGRTFVSSGPVLDFTLARGGTVFYPGDTVEGGEYILSLGVDESPRRKVWGSFGIQTTALRLIHNGKILKTIPAAGSGHWTEPVKIDPGWMRVEGYGSCGGKAGELLFFSGAVYIGQDEAASRGG
jgi:hypothetical protein